jgi:phage protein D
MVAAAPPALRAARPTINVCGQDRAALGQGLVGLLIADPADGLARCEATFGNWGATPNGVGFLYFDRKLIDFGKPFVVKLGTDTLFEGRITALEAQYPTGRPPRLNVLAEDRLQELRMTRRTRTFPNATDADVVRQVAGEHGLSADVDLPGPSYAVLAQVNQSDLAFLRDRARAAGAEVWVEGTSLKTKPRTKRGGSPLKLTYQQGLREFTVTADLAGQRTGVAVGGWDVAGKAALKGEADDAAVRGELNGGKSGPSVLSAALGDRKESVAHAVPLGSDEAKAVAESVMRTLARRFVVGRGVAETDARLRAGSSAELHGLGPLFDGVYYLSGVRHLFDGTQGLRTEFTAERPGLGG